MITEVIFILIAWFRLSDC